MKSGSKREGPSHSYSASGVSGEQQLRHDAMRDGHDSQRSGSLIGRSDGKSMGRGSSIHIQNGDHGGGASDTSSIVGGGGDHDASGGYLIFNLEARLFKFRGKEIPQG